MRDKYIQTAESVTEGHPDKLCDTIADTVLDNCLEYDPSARVACEALATAGKILVAGEITAKVIPDIPAIVARTVQKAGYETEYEIEVITHDQSTDIAEAVGGDKTASPQQGAGDQGIMYGYACLETDELLPLPVVLAHRLTRLLTDVRKAGTIRGLGPDGKAQVSVEYVFGLPSRITSVVISCQHEPDKTLKDLRREVMEYVVMPALQELPPDEETEILINPSGRFVLGGFEADTGLTGRKLMVDTYGGLVPHGGGALSGRMGRRWTAAEPTWLGISPRILWLPGWRSGARSLWPTPSVRRNLWRWTLTPTGPASMPPLCWNRLFTWRLIGLRME